LARPAAPISRASCIVLYARVDAQRTAREEGVMSARRIGAAGVIVWTMVGIGCGPNQGIDASVPHDDAPIPDTGAVPTDDAFSSATCFPLPEGQWMLSVDPAGTCPLFMGTPTHDVTVDDLCNVTFTSRAPGSGFDIMGSARLDDSGGFPATSFRLAGTAVTCEATYSVADGVSLLAFECSGCTFTIRHGE
jgi:hypothetical protein